MLLRAVFTMVTSSCTKPKPRLMAAKVRGLANAGPLPVTRVASRRCPRMRPQRSLMAQRSLRAQRSGGRAGRTGGEAVELSLHRIDARKIHAQLVIPTALAIRQLKTVAHKLI